MLLKVTDLHKSIGPKILFDGLDLSFDEGEKVALIGRNGLGKTTLFKILNGEDSEISGEIQRKKGLRIIMTRQEHFLSDDVTAMDYILDDVPEYRSLQKIIKNYEENASSDMDHLQEYTDAVMKYSELGYYEIEDKIVSALKAFQIEFDQVFNPLVSFSGGEKRFVELVRVMYSGADLALIDEPTNHMDYVGKEMFIDWLKKTDQSIFVITHDRDVLHYVTKIYELKDRKILQFDGDYDSYIQQNNSKTVSAISAYETGLKKIADVKRKLDEAAKKKAYKSGKIVYERFLAEYNTLKQNLDKPSFWIDQESLEKVSQKTIEKYDKYKERNIIIQNKNVAQHKKELLKVRDLSVGYVDPLFKDINLHLYNHDRIFVKGRNGAGKSTLVKTLISKIKEEDTIAKVFNGDFKFSQTMRLGVYEQEIQHHYVNMKLADAIYEVYESQKLEINDQKVMQLLNTYLFDPRVDGSLPIHNLSGGQKARFQIIKMLSNSPDLLILDEPTNHLDLPSIEQLENVLMEFTGAIVYITHDNYLVDKLGGKVIEL